MIMVIGRIEVKADCLDKALALCLEHVKRSRAEPGCIDHRVASDCEDPLQLVFVEYWADMDALKAHFALDASRKFVSDLTEYLTAKPDMRIFDASEIHMG